MLFTLSMIRIPFISFYIGIKDASCSIKMSISHHANLTYPNDVYLNLQKFGQESKVHTFSHSLVQHSLLFHSTKNDPILLTQCVNALILYKTFENKTTNIYTLFSIALWPHQDYKNIICKSTELACYINQLAISSLNSNLILRCIPTLKMM